MKKRIVIIDDDIVIVRLCRHYLESEHNEIWSYQDPEKFLSEVAMVDPCVAVVDYRLPGMSGVDLMEKAQAVLGKKIPSVFITGNSDSLTKASIEHQESCKVFQK